MRIFRWPVRVYIENTDAGGIVYYADYLCFLERARTEWLRAAGIELGDIARLHRSHFVVRSVNVQYRQPARLNDELEVSVNMRSLKSASLQLEQNVYRGTECLVEGWVALACVDVETGAPVRIPAELKEAITGEC